MQVRSTIIQPVSVDVVNNLSWFCPSDFAVFPLSAAAFASVPQTKVSCLLPNTVPVALFYRGVGGNSYWNVGYGTDHPVSTALMLPAWKPVLFALVAVKRIAVLVPHLIMSPAHLSGDDRALAMSAGAPDDLPSPTVVGRAVPLHPLIVHQAKAVGRVFPVASGNVASLHACNDNASHSACRNKAIGNSVMAFIGRRIQQVENLISAQEAA